MAALPRLQTLAITKSEYFVDLALFAHHPTLAKLELTTCGVLDLNALQWLTQLQVLRLETVDVIHCSDGQVLLPLKNLQKLDWFDVTWREMQVLVPPHPSQVHALGADPCMLREMLPYLLALRGLHMSTTGRGGMRVPRLPRLQQLRIVSYTIDDVEAIADLRCLTRLDLRIGRLSDLAPLAAAPQLQELDLTDCPDVQTVEPLHKLTELRVLKLSNTRLTTVEPLRELTKLRVLLLDDTDITSVAPLAPLARLEDLNVLGTDVTDLSPLGGRRLRYLTTLAIPEEVDCTTLTVSR